jgi:hypothetical protein
MMDIRRTAFGPSAIYDREGCAMTVKLKIFMQGGFCMPGCCGFTTGRTTDGEVLYSDQRENVAGVGKLMSAIKEQYGEQVEVSVVNSWGFFALWDVLRLKITPSIPAWVLEGKKICEGLPERGDLLQVLDAELKK